MFVNELHCDGVRLVFRTRHKTLNGAVAELEDFMKMFNIECELSGMMRLYGDDDSLLEVC